MTLKSYQKSAKRGIIRCQISDNFKQRWVKARAGNWFSAKLNQWKSFALAASVLIWIICIISGSTSPSESSLVLRQYWTSCYWMNIFLFFPSFVGHKLIILIILAYPIVAISSVKKFTVFANWNPQTNPSLLIALEMDSWHVISHADKMLDKEVVAPSTTI